jgi:hypothetical protein
MHSEISLFFGILAILAGAVFTAFQLRGIVHIVPARICLVTAWFFALAGIGLSDPIATRSWTYITIALAATGAIGGGILVAADRWASQECKTEGTL